jgi:hypothetical protein
MEEYKYEILQAHTKYENNILISVAVLWKRYGEIRASFSDLNRSVGYHYLKDYDVFATHRLLIKIADEGRQLNDKEKKIYFPKQKIA